MALVTAAFKSDPGAVLATAVGEGQWGAEVAKGGRSLGKKCRLYAVSYTHLTLPTILRV